MAGSPHRVHLVVSWAPLLSGDLDECFTPDDASCQGGVAAVAAYLRHYSQSEPSLVLPFADKESPFVQMHPLQWNVNRLILHDIMGWKLFGSAPSLLAQNSIDFEVSRRDISALQSTEMPLLLTNALIPPGNSWHPYTVPVYLDETTGLALLSVFNSNSPLNAPQIDSVRGVLHHVARLNAGCPAGSSSSGQQQQQQQEQLYYQYANKTMTDSESVLNHRHCWVPVVLFADTQKAFAVFLDAAVQLEHPPALVVDLENGVYESPVLLNEKVWVVSHSKDGEAYLHHAIELSSKSGGGGSNDPRRITGVTAIVEDLTKLNATLKDEQYARDIRAIRQQADKAFESDPIVGQSTYMPFTRNDGNYRRCMAGECHIGNLFMDAVLHAVPDANVAFMSSGGLRGPGWPAGDVRVSDIWGANPFPNTLCTGVMSGVSMFKLFNYSINAATFEGEKTNNGDRLLQVSGMRVTYNTKMKGSRLVAMDVWNKTEEKYLPLERLRLYKFVTDSWNCGGFKPFPTLLGEALVWPGEEPGTTSDILIQNVVGDYLSDLGEPYVVGIKGRLVNDTSATESLNLVQTADSCRPGTYWRRDVFTCAVCPDSSGVTFLRQDVEFEGSSGSDSDSFRSIVLTNSELYNVAVVPKSRPSWLKFSRAELESSGEDVTIVDGVPRTLLSGERMTIFLEVDTTDLEAGTAQGTASFGVLDGGSYPGCTGQDATFEALVRISPQQELNQLGSIRFVGFALSLVVGLSALFFTSWVLRNRELRIVRTLQPAFLVTISTGTLIMGLTMIPLSIDDEIAPDRGCSIACMSRPWLLSMGFTVAMSALFSKLWRINKLFRSAGVRRIRVQEKDVIGPFAVLFTLNFLFLFLWTLIEPFQWVRIEVEDQPWNTIGVCRTSKDGNGSVTITMMVLVSAVNVIALVAAGFQAYQARNISDEFSESKNIGIALFSWCQIFLVGVPVLYLIDEDNPSARYFLQVILVFAVTMSMLSLIFIPMIVQNFKIRREERWSARRQRESAQVSKFSVKQVGHTHVSGLNPPEQEMSQLSSELGKLSFLEHTPIGDDPLYNGKATFASSISGSHSDGSSELGVAQLSKKSHLSPVAALQAVEEDVSEENNVASMGDIIEQGDDGISSTPSGHSVARVGEVIKNGDDGIPKTPSARSDAGKSDPPSHLYFK